MRKGKTVLAAGIAAAMLLMSGCSGQAATETKISEETTVTETEGSENMAENTEVLTEAAGETESVENQEEPEGEADLSAPVKIWGQILETGEGTITVDNQSEGSFSGEIIFNISPESTFVLDAATGFPTELSEVKKGSFEAYLGSAMTLSLPPQATPYVVIVNIPEDFAAPQYAVAAGNLEEKAGVRVLTANDGRTYELAEDVQISPYLTRNIVTLEDIQAGSRCLLWLNAENTVERIVLFAE